MKPTLINNPDCRNFICDKSCGKCKTPSFSLSYETAEKSISNNIPQQMKRTKRISLIKMLIEMVFGLALAIALIWVMVKFFEVKG